MNEVQHVQQQEEYCEGVCKEHASKYNIKDYEAYMTKQGIEDCEDMPCHNDCPLGGGA